MIICSRGDRLTGPRWPTNGGKTSLPTWGNSQERKHGLSSLVAVNWRLTLRLLHPVGTGGIRGRAIPVDQVFKDTLVTLLKRHDIKEWNEQDQSELIASWPKMTGESLPSRRDLLECLSNFDAGSMARHRWGYEQTTRKIHCYVAHKWRYPNDHRRGASGLKLLLPQFHNI